jgi:hypothetical protein
MKDRVIEHKIKLEKSVKIILGVLAFGVFLNAFAPVFDVRDVFASSQWERAERGSNEYPVHIICRQGC